MSDGATSLIGRTVINQDGGFTWKEGTIVGLTFVPGAGSDEPLSQWVALIETRSLDSLQSVAMDAVRLAPQR